MSGRVFTQSAFRGTLEFVNSSLHRLNAASSESLRLGCFKIKRLFLGLSLYDPCGLLGFVSSILGMLTSPLDVEQFAGEI